MHRFKELKVWQKSRELVKVIYVALQDFPKDERFGIISQIQRASISISSNIAEGAGRNTEKDFCRFLDIANGSCFELESLLILASDLNYLNEKDFNSFMIHIEEIQKMLFSLRKTLSNKS